MVGYAFETLEDPMGRSVMERFEVSSLFEPDVLLSSRVPQRHAALLPEQRLQLAVVEQAVLDLKLTVEHAPITAVTRAGKRRTDADIRRVRHEQTRDQQRAASLREQARLWFLSENREGPFAFVNICEAVGFDPHYLRRGLGLKPPPLAA